MVNDREFELQQTKTLFLGLSDGARTDRFRRAYPDEIINEQIWHAYDLSEEKEDDLREKLKERLKSLSPKKRLASKFDTLVLLDDFSASGTSFIREKDVDNWGGKLHKIFNKFEQNDPQRQLLSKNCSVMIVLYVATEIAVEHIRNNVKERLSNSHLFKCENFSIDVVHTLEQEIKVVDSNNANFLSLVENDKYFDATVDDEHVKIGGTNSYRYGYGDGRLPVILCHNTPNNSIFLLWAEENLDFIGLFPRVSRHRSFEK